MKILNKTEFMAMPSGTIYQEVEPNVTTGPLSIKRDNCGVDDFFYIALDAVSLFGDTRDIMNGFENGGGMACFSTESRDGNFDPDTMYLCLDRDEVLRLKEML
jgi:hypothetical protein